VLIAEHALGMTLCLNHAHHRQVAADSSLGQAVNLSARADQSLSWERTRQVLRHVVRRGLCSGVAYFVALPECATMRAIAVPAATRRRSL
jgi:hypothetical protein